MLHPQKGVAKQRKVKQKGSNGPRSGPTLLTDRGTTFVNLALGFWITQFPDGNITFSIYVRNEIVKMETFSSKIKIVSKNYGGHSRISFGANIQLTSRTV